MTRTDLLERLTHGENSGIEFAPEGTDPDRLAQHAVAMANLKGGSILLGVEDDGSISGIQRNDLEHWVMDTVFGRYVHPMILPYFDVVTLDDGRRVAVVTLTEGSAKPYAVRQNDREEATCAWAARPAGLHESNSRGFSKVAGCFMPNCCRCQARR